jgi:hypothetical protein
MKAMPHEAAEETPIEAALSRTGFPLNRSASFMRAPCNSSGNAIGPACQSITSGSPGTNPQTPKSYRLHKVVIA